MQAGQRFEDPSQIDFLGTWEDVRLAAYDPQSMIRENEMDGVWGACLQPSQGLFWYRIPDGAMLSAICRVYNGWIAEFCKPHGDRLKGIAMSVGAMAGVLSRYPDLLYAPLEIKGDAEVHALSRCQMILTEAKKRAHQEFEDALTAAGLTVRAVCDHLDAHPELKSATYRVPHQGAVGTAANLVLHLARRIG